MKSFWQSSGSCQFVFHWFYRSNNRHSDVRHLSTWSLSNTLANPKELRSHPYGPQLILATSKATVWCYNKRCNCCTRMTPLIWKLPSSKQALLSWLLICSTQWLVKWATLVTQWHTNRDHAALVAITELLCSVLLLSATWRDRKPTTHAHKEVTAGRNGREKKTEIVRVSGPQEDNFRRVWSLHSWHPGQDNSHAVLQLPASLPALPGPKEQRGPASCTATAHTEQFCGQHTGQNHSLLGSAAVERVSVAITSHAHTTACDTAQLCTPEPNPALLPTAAPPLSRSLLSSSHLHTSCPCCLCHWCAPRSPGHSSRCPGTLPAPFRSCAFPQDRQNAWDAAFPTGKAQRTHCIFPTWLGRVK